MKKLLAIIVLGLLLSGCSDYKACKKDAIDAGMGLEGAVRHCGGN